MCVSICYNVTKISQDKIGFDYPMIKHTWVDYMLKVIMSVIAILSWQKGNLMT